MVGVSGRSKGCITCRQRKVKCDEGRPTCNRCKNGYFICLGYARPVVFVDEGSIPQKSRVRRRAPTQTISSSDSTIGVLSKAVTQVENSVETVLPTSQILPFNQILNLNAFKDNILISHLLKNLFVEYTDSTLPPGNASWISQIIQTPDNTSTSYVSALALAAAFFGQVQKEKVVLEQGTQKYGRALRQLNSDLQDSERAVTYFTMTSALLLSLYELVVFSNISGWLEHFNGIGILTKMAGPYAYQTRPALDIFCVNRMFIVLNAIIQRKHCFLEELSWKTIPWALGSHPKNYGDYFQDILCDVPGFLEDNQKIQQLETSGADTTHLLHILRNRLNISLNTLYSLRWKWEHDYPQVCYEVIPLESETICLDTTGKLLFPSTFHFRNVRRAIEIGLYNTALLFHLDLLESLGGHSSPDTERLILAIESSIHQPTNPLLLPGQGTRIDVAREICRIVDYHLLGNLHTAGALQLMFPLRVALRAFHPKSQEAMWIGSVMRRIADRDGFEISRHGLSTLISRQ
ncbi:hypothetical protein F5884DRAFT_833615 [Xylogone sp. PMI_703]|nr:hypothetical protein F5884DRAFT_833615 [Xylogone sp. PMI_703]